MSCSNIWTPRGTTKLWPVPKGGRLTLKQCTFHPTRSTPEDYAAPPPPPPIQSAASIRRRTAQKQSTAPVVKASDLITRSAELRKEAERLEQSAPALSLTLQFGTLVLEYGVDAFSKRYLKEWDQRGRGEVAPRRRLCRSIPSLVRAFTLARALSCACCQFLKGEFRNNLRSLSLNASSTEADALFDSWDEDGGGTLDLEELRQAFKQTAEKARRYHAALSTGPLGRARALRERAASADEAAECAMRRTRPVDVSAAVPHFVTSCHHT